MEKKIEMGSIVKHADEIHMSTSMYQPFTLLTELCYDGLGNALRDVHLSAQAGDTHVGWVGGDGSTTCAAQAGRGRRQ